MDFVEVATVNDLPPGRAKTVVVDGRSVALYHTASGFFASDNACPHRGGPLGEGDVLGDEIVCPWHFWTFDIRSGHCLAQPSISITTHEVKLEGDRVLIRLANQRVWS